MRKYFVDEKNKAKVTNWLVKTVGPLGHADPETGQGWRFSPCRTQPNRFILTLTDDTYIEALEALLNNL